MLDDWVSVQSLPPLVEDEVQIWRIELPRDDTPVDGYSELLSSEERARSGRVRAGRVRLQFVVARTALRMLLGNCLGVDPKSVAITQTSFGKPEIAGLFFNVAHSGKTILIALCQRHRVGIDIEYFSREIEALEIAKTSFSANEYLALSSISDAEDLRRSFFRCWTRKEAVIKADGRGLSLPLESFEVPMTQNARDAAVFVAASDRAEGGYYWLSDIRLSEAAAACAISSSGCALRRFVLPL